MEKPKFTIVTEQMKFDKPEQITVMICQMIIDYVNFDLTGNPDYKKNLHITSLQIEEVIKNARKNKPDLIIFPELSIPKSKVKLLQDFSSEGKGCVIVAGSHYAETDEGAKINVSPILINGKEFITEKIIPSYLETNPIQRLKHLTVEDGKIIWAFKDSPIGNFSVVICNDINDKFIRDDLSNLKFKKKKYKLDFVVVIALQRKSEKYYEVSFPTFLANHEREGVYILYSNCLGRNEKVLSDGKCSLLGSIDNCFRGAFLKSNSSDFSSNNKIIELRDECLYFLAEINLKNKVPPAKHPYNYRCNILYKEKYSGLKLNTDNNQKMAVKKKSSNTGYKKYLDALMKFTGHINFAGLAEDDKSAITPRSLKDLFISLKVSTFLDYNISSSDVHPLITEDNLTEKKLLSEKVLNERQNQQAKQIEKKSSIRYEKRNLGEVINENKRIVILGDPGCGKTILTQWIANAYSLRKTKFSDVDILDTNFLPDVDLMPVLIRCRDYKEDKLEILLKGTLQQILSNALYLESFGKNEIEEIGKELENRIGDGKILIIIDGLDEIENSNSRTLFCSKLHDLSKEYFNCYFLATSRIKGYNELNSHIGNEFAHLRIDSLDNDDKKTFIHKWCQATLPAHGLKEQIKEYSKSLTISSVSALTNNPLLLTNICLLKRTRPLLPERKNEVYEESIKLLFNRRPFSERRIDFKVGASYLEYIAYDMCEKGVSQINKFDLIEIIKEYRIKFPTLENNKYIIDDFLSIIEGQTGLLVETGREKIDGFPEPILIYEFKHKTFQEYFAGKSLVDGRYNDYSFKQSFSQKLLMLISQTEDVEIKDNGKTQTFKIVKEFWHEPIKFAVTSSTWQQTEEAFNSMVNPTESELQRDVIKARLIMALECLAENPIELSLPLAEETIRKFISLYDNVDAFSTNVRTAYDQVLKVIAYSKWNEKFKEIVLDMASSMFQEHLAKIYVMLFVEDDYSLFNLNIDLKNSTEFQKLDFCLKCLEFFFEKVQLIKGKSGNSEELSNALKLITSNRLISKLWKIAESNESSLREAAIWALGWSNNAREGNKGFISLKSSDKEKLVHFLSHSVGEKDTVWSVYLLTKEFLNYQYPDDYIYIWAVHADTYLRNKEEIPFQINKEINTDLLQIILQQFQKPLTSITKQYLAVRLVKIGFVNDTISKSLIDALCNNDLNSEYRDLARLGLGLCCSKECMPMLVNCLENEDEDIRNDAFLSLVGLRNSDLNSSLIKTLQNPYAIEDARYNCAYVLGTQCRTEDIIIALTKASNDDDMPKKVRSQVVTSLKHQLGKENDCD